MVAAKFLPTIIGPPVNHRAEILAFWNPCCGGMFIAFLCYQINLEGGAFMVDSIFQLRIVLHLYNALQQRNLISGNIPLLTSLANVFERAPSVWAGGKPTRNNMVMRFWVAYGMRLDMARCLHQYCRQSVLKTRSARKKNDSSTDDNNDDVTR
jgi:hypothetical protein